MRPRHKLKPQKKSVYFLASVALHVLLAGLLIYFYSSFFSHSQEQTKAEKAADLPAPAIDEESPIAREDSTRDSITRSPPPLPSQASRNEEITELLEPPEEEPLIEVPPPLVPLPENDSAPLSRLDPEQESLAQESTPAPEVDRLDENLESKLTAEEPPLPTAPASVSESSAQDKMPLDEGIIRAQLTTGVEQHEPINRLGKVIPVKKDGVKRLYYFTEVKNMMGKTIIHRWEHEGQVIAEVPLSIGSYQWRTYSSKDLTPTMTGRWQVIVLDEKGTPLHTDSFVYQGS